MFLLKELGVYIIVGILPVFIFFLWKTKSLDQSLSWAAAGSGLPFIIIQCFVTLTGINLEILWIIPFILISSSLLFIIMKQGLLSEQNWNDFFGRLSAGIIIGIIWWFFGFLPNILQMRAYSDVMWNTGNAAQFLHFFHIQDPHWVQEGSLNYHFYSHRVIAGIGLVTGTELIQIVMKFISFITTINIAILVTAKEFRKSVIFGIIGFVLVIILRPTTSWGPNLSFVMHMTGWAGSTYFWTLPITIGGILWWFKWDKIRYNYIFDDNKILKKVFTASILTLIIVVIITYSKASGAMVFIGLEFISFLFTSFKLIKSKLMCENYLKLIFFSISIIALIFADLLIFHNFFFHTNGDYNKLSVGWEAKDLAVLKGNIIIGIIATAGIPVMFAILVKKFSKKQMILLSVALLNFFLFVILTHPSFSDLFFMFNAIILGGLSVSIELERKKIPHFLIAILILSLSCLIFPNYGLKIKGFKSFYSIGKQSAEVKIINTDYEDLLRLKKFIKSSRIIVYPYDPDESFRLSAILEAPFWNESARFTDYSIPNAKIIFNGMPESIDSRITFTKKWVFDSDYKAPEQYKDIIKKFGYIFIKTSDITRLSSIFKNKKIEKGNVWSLVILSEFF